MNETQVLDLVAKHLQSHQPANFSLDLIRNGVQHDGNWWYVIVLPNPRDVRAYEYNNVMAEIEDEIEADEKIKVMLVPAIPD